MSRSACVQGFKSFDDVWDVSRSLSTFAGHVYDNVSLSQNGAHALKTAGAITSLAVFPQIGSKVIDISKDMHALRSGKEHSIKPLVLDALSLIGNGCDAIVVVVSMGLIRAQKAFSAAPVISDSITVVVDGAEFFSHVEKAGKNYKKMHQAVVEKKINYYHKKSWQEGIRTVKTICSVGMAAFALLSLVFTSFSTCAAGLVLASGVYVVLTLADVFLSRSIESKRKSAMSRLCPG
ncbi:MAG: hypothetical protein V4494_00295 [Chlamydiota bacterium]